MRLPTETRPQRGRVGIHLVVRTIVKNTVALLLFETLNRFLQLVRHEDTPERVVSEANYSRGNASFQEFPLHGMSAGDVRNIFGKSCR